MTAGERAIWAAAFVSAYNEHVERSTRLDSYGTLVPSARRLALAPAMAASDAARMVRAAREALPKLVETLKPDHPSTTETIEMLREMLGVTDGDPYR